MERMEIEISSRREIERTGSGEKVVLAKLGFTTMIRLFRSTMLAILTVAPTEHTILIRQGDRVVRSTGDLLDGDPVLHEEGNRLREERIRTLAVSELTKDSKTP